MLESNGLLKSTIFWDITPYSPLKVNRRFWGTYRLHLQGRRIISRARNQGDSRADDIPTHHGIQNFANREVWFCLPHALTLVSCAAYSSTLKMEAICSSETSDFQQTTRLYIPEDRTLQKTKVLKQVSTAQWRVQTRLTITIQKLWTQL
jgi:hypothetical protein